MERERVAESRQRNCASSALERTDRCVSYKSTADTRLGTRNLNFAFANDRDEQK